MNYVTIILSILKSNDNDIDKSLYTFITTYKITWDDYNKITTINIHDEYYELFKKRLYEYLNHNRFIDCFLLTDNKYKKLFIQEKYKYFYKRERKNPYGIEKLKKLLNSNSLETKLLVKEYINGYIEYCNLKNKEGEDMLYIDWEKLDNERFLEFIKKIRKEASTINNTYKEDYKEILERIDNLLKYNRNDLTGFDIKSLEANYRYIKSLDTLSDVEILLDNSNNLNQTEIDNILNNIYVDEACFKSVCNSLGLKLSMIVKHIFSVEEIPNLAVFEAADEVIDNIYIGYKESENKNKFIKRLYESNCIYIDELRNYFDVILDYYVRSITDTDFDRVYLKYPINKILEIDKIIKIYDSYLNRISNFLNGYDKNYIEVSFDIDKFINEYNKYKVKDDFFSYMYMTNNVTEATLANVINCFKCNYLDEYGIEYNELLNKLYKLKKIYDEYVLFIGNIFGQDSVDKEIINTFLYCNKDLDFTFMDLYRKNKLINIRECCSIRYRRELNPDDLLRYSILIHFITNRLNMIKDSELFKDTIILSNNKNKELYYNFMNEYYFKEGYKPNDLSFKKAKLTDIEKKLVDDYLEKYFIFYNKKSLEKHKTSFISTRELDTKDIDRDKLASIVDKLMESDPRYVLLDFYSMSEYSIPVFYNLVKYNLPMNKKIFFSNFYNKYKDDISVSEERKKELVDCFNMSFVLETDSNGNVLERYDITLEDKKQALILLDEQGIPVTNKTFNLMLYKLYDSIKERLLEEKKLIKNKRK